MLTNTYRKFANVQNRIFMHFYVCTNVENLQISKNVQNVHTMVIVTFPKYSINAIAN